MKTIILYFIKFLGGFWLSRKLIRNKTLILAYHSFEVFDESEFRPNLFIKYSTLTQRLKYLKTHCNVVSLSEIEQSNKPINSVVITVDDGWASTLSHASSVFSKFNFPYTIYLTTENVLDNQPVFHILLDYILQASVGKTLTIILKGKECIKTVVSINNIENLKKEIALVKTKRLDTELLTVIARSLDVDIGGIIDKKSFSLMSVDEVKNIAQLGADIQLHTHSHHTYLFDENAFEKDLQANQQHIEDITGIKPLHHCYPSGSYNADSIQWLKRLGIKTATTCNPGFCDEQSNKLALPRFLDGENIPQIVFEAEVSGVLEVFRKLKSLIISGKLRTVNS
ncbi:MAG: polysaccharide deacetylase family protein [Colwellia sp.]|uniref:polysaccharide deacetylase family protein n=1 Tax=Colwellia sp. TaxID=56799 RepID=UPI0025B9C67E|nr:polysaccharide deacetylase family protein [Colwellia sp.]NQZ25373.1 polysaccharide deacetylase family protein [Colwellia sp.]